MVKFLKEYSKNLDIPDSRSYENLISEDIT